MIGNVNTVLGRALYGKRGARIRRKRCENIIDLHLAITVLLAKVAALPFATVVGSSARLLKAYYIR